MHREEVLCSNNDYYYDIRYKKKKSGKKRVIQAPSPRLKQIQKEFADWFLEVKKEDFKKNPQVIGFMPGKSIADNAKPHMNKDWIVNLDIADFFPSTHSSEITEVIEKLPRSIHLFDWFKEIKPSAFKRMKNKDIEKILIFKKGLPQGSPASPAIANYVAIKKIDDYVKISMDIFNENNDIYNLSYTRYADDLTLSFNGGDRRDAKELVHYIKNAVDMGNIYKIKDEKTCIKHKSQRQLVTGVLVNGENPKVDRRIMNKMRAIIHNAKRDNKSLDEEASGMLSFIQSINKEQYQKLISQGERNGSN